VPFSRTEPNVPAYEEDPNSPFTATNTASATFTLANPSDRVLVLTDSTTTGLDRLQVNNFTGAGYNTVTNDGGLVNDATSFRVGFGARRHRITLTAREFELLMSVQPGTTATNAPVFGRCGDVSRPITDLTFLGSSAFQNDIRFRAYALDV